MSIKQHLLVTGKTRPNEAVAAKPECIEQSEGLFYHP